MIQALVLLDRHRSLMIVGCAVGTVILVHELVVELVLQGHNRLRLMLLNHHAHLVYILFGSSLEVATCFPWSLDWSLYTKGIFAATWLL